jgi:hypothetical protein
MPGRRFIKLPFSQSEKSNLARPDGRVAASWVTANGVLDFRPGSKSEEVTMSTYLPPCPRTRTLPNQLGTSHLCHKQTSGLRRWRKHSCSRHPLFRVCKYYGVSPYIAFSWPWAKARAGGISILPPTISIYAPVWLVRAAFIASSSSPSVVTRAVYQFAHPSAFGNSA